MDGVIRLEWKVEQDGTEDFSSDHPHAIKLLLDFIYLGDYMPPEQLRGASQATAFKASKKGKNKLHHQEAEAVAVNEVASTNVEVDEQRPLEMHARMYSLASKYDLPTLKTTAVTKYYQAAQGNSFDSKDLATAITIAYNTGSEGEAEMRKAVLASIIRNLKLAATETCIRDAISRERDLAIEIMAALAVHCSCHSSYGDPNVVNSKRCGYCGNHSKSLSNCQFCGRYIS